MAPKRNTALYRDKKKNAASKKIKSAMKRLHEQSRSKEGTLIGYGSSESKMNS